MGLLWSTVVTLATTNNQHLLPLTCRKVALISLWGTLLFLPLVSAAFLIKMETMTCAKSAGIFHHFGTHDPNWANQDQGVTFQDF